MSTVVGIAQNQHDSCLSVVRDGKVVVHVELERVLRRKRATFESPAQALALLSWTLREHGVSYIDAVAVVRHMVEPEVKELMSLLRSAHPAAEIMWFEHLDCHAALAAASGADDCLTLALDGGGDRRIRANGPNAVLERWRDGRPQQGCVLGADMLAIDGRAWSVLSYALFGDEHAAGKVMGLAAHGHDDERARERVDELIAASLGWRYDDVGRDALARALAVEKFQQGADAAAVLQERFTEAMTTLVARAAPDGSRVVLTGGCALNVVANTAVAGLPEVQAGVWVPPCPGDEGISLGAALRAAATLGDRVVPLRSPYLGLGDGGRADDGSVRAAAEELARGKVVVSAVGPSEAGPRALGNRSFLALPTEQNRTLVSERMKRREWFRPVAPALRAADMSEWLREPVESPYMSFAAEATPAMVEQCPGVVHVDGTARHQTVDHEHHPNVAALLDALADLGVPPVLINTSLNTNGRPICLDASDAVATALEAGAHAILLPSGLTRLA